MKDLVIIDGNSLVNRAFYALPLLSTSKGKIYNAVYGFCNILVKLITENKPNFIVVAFDAAKKTFRNELFADYKGTRKGMPEELAAQMPVLKDVLKKMNIKTVEKVGIEADDIIGTISRRFDNVHNIIVTGDRDSLQLINQNTDVWLTKHGISQILELNERQLKEEFGLSPSQVIDLKSLMGDQSDNIPGVKGIGEKTAMALLEQYGTMENVYAHINEISGKTKEKLEEGKEMAKLSYKLATILPDCEFDCTLEDCTYTFPFNAELKKDFEEYEFKSLTKREELFNSGFALEENPVITTELNSSQIKSLLNSSKEFSFLIKEEKIYFSNNEKENFVAQLNQENLTAFKPFLENASVLKIFYDKKSILHKLSELSITAANSVDVSLGAYLINSNLQVQNIEPVFEHFGFNSQGLGSSLIACWNFLKDELEKENLTQLYFNIELPLVDVLFDMERTGICVNAKVLDELRPVYIDEAKRIEQQIFEYAGCEFNVSSPKQLAEVLFNKLNLSDYDNKKHSTAVEKLQLLCNSHPIINLILRYRKITKIVSTYIDGMEVFIKEDNKIHTTFNQTLTVTGRLSSTEPNLQNLPIRSEEGKELRKMFVPSSKNNVLISSDYSQIELRLLAHYSKDANLCDAYKHNKDIHASTASQIFNIPLSEVTDLHRRTAKAVNFGIIYGISPFGLARNLGISQKLAKEYIDRYFATYPTIKNFLNESVAKAHEQGFVTSLFGRKRNLDLSIENKQLLAFNERAAMNMPLQGTASDIIKLSMLNIYYELKKRKLKTKMILQIHDELIFDAPKEELNEVLALIKDKMENVVKLNVPLPVSISYGENLYDCK